MLQRLPKLQSLDGRDVEPAERVAVGACLRHEAAILTLMLANANLAHKLVRAGAAALHRCIVHVPDADHVPATRADAAPALQRLVLQHMELHSELLALLRPRHEISSVPVPARILQLWSLEQHQTPTVRLHHNQQPPASCLPCMRTS